MVSELQEDGQLGTIDTGKTERKTSRDPILANRLSKRKNPMNRTIRSMLVLGLLSVPLLAVVLPLGSKSRDQKSGQNGLKPAQIKPESRRRQLPKSRSWAVGSH